jgi:hypothetical protein
VHPVQIIVVRFLRLLMSKVSDKVEPLRSAVVIPVLLKLNLLQLAVLTAQLFSLTPARLVQLEKFILPLSVCRAEKITVPFSPVQPWKFMVPATKLVSTGKEGASVNPVQLWKLSVPPKLVSTGKVGAYVKPPHPWKFK